METKLRILIVHNYYQIPGGEDIVVENEKKLLENNGHVVMLYSRDNSEIESMTLLKKICLPFSMIFSFRTYKEVKQLIQEHNINILHVHNTMNLISPSVYYAAFHCNIPVVQTMHNFRLLCPGATFYRDGHICEECIERGLGCAIQYGCYRNSKLQTFICVLTTKIHRLLRTYKKVNFICLTEFNSKKLLQLNRPVKNNIVDPDKVFIKPNFTFANTGQFFQGEYYLFVGRIEKIKGLDILIEAFSQIPDRKLLIAGTGTELNKYMLLARSYNAQNIKFTGFLKHGEVGKAYNRAIAVIVPSQWYETFGMIIAEAFASHVPVIAGDIGNIGSLVVNGKNGLTFKYNSCEALINTIEHFEKLDRVSYGEAAYQTYINQFSPESNYKQLLKIYDQIK
ncbi:glycosyltransferase [Diplocloster hominis]|uniref:glycosyltransferase n=1 Tax=Diplocloster hominis TaxID=3079010 RepID=UPI0031BA1506